METTEQWFAGQRLAFSCWVARLWTAHTVEWVVVLSRIVENTSKYALLCLDLALASINFEEYDSLTLWSDGPAQFKSIMYLGTPQA